MPGTPAVTHTATASSTSGSLPPLELRSVATLLTFADSFIDGVDNLPAPPVDLLQILSFQHHAQERLGARIAHEQASIAAECRSTSAMTAATSGIDASSRFSFTRTFNSTCG